MPTVSQKGILRPQVGEQHFRLARYMPSDDLAFFVERYWIVEWDLRERDPYYSETLPYPCVNLVVEAGRSGAFGISTRRWGRWLEGQGRAVSIKFRPGAFQPFLREPVAALNDSSRTLSELFGSTGDRLEAEVLATAQHEGQIALLEAFVRERLPPRDEDIALAGDAVGRVYAEPAITRVEQLTERLGLSTRTLQRLFQKYVGVSPKWVIQRCRLQEAADRLSDGHTVDWAALALELGYFDQAHFVKDFKALVGLSPTEYAAACAARVTVQADSPRSTSARMA